MRILDDVMDPARARAMQAMLGQEATIAAGDPLPPFFHQLYFWHALPPDRLGADGHPKLGDLIPDMGLPRRMWAGGRLAFHHALRAGVPATCRTVLDQARRKDGRSGPLAFVTLRHDIHQDGQLCLTDWQDLVYRQPAVAAAPVERARRDEAHSETAQFNQTDLFRYSALTFNGHRIHYDRDYARQVEGYPGLVVHGPLLAQRLMLLAWQQLGRLTRFEFRATAPLIEGEQATFCWHEGAAWVRGADGRLCMRATAG